MKNNIKVSAVVLIMAIGLLLQGCGNKQSEYSDETLKSFMLAGVYAAQSYGGDVKFRAMTKGSSKEEIINSYKEVLVFYFDPEYADLCNQTLSEYWDINDKASLVETLEDLKTTEVDYKAWDYARLANNAVQGYCAGYLTKEEVLALLEETLALTKERYDDWEAYHEDFNLGRLNWNPNAPDRAQFTMLTNTIQKGDNSIFKLLPLK